MMNKLRVLIIFSVCLFSLDILATTIPQYVWLNTGTTYVKCLVIEKGNDGRLLLEAQTRHTVPSKWRNLFKNAVSGAKAGARYSKSLDGGEVFVPVEDGVSVWLDTGPDLARSEVLGKNAEGVLLLRALDEHLILSTKNLMGNGVSIESEGALYAVPSVSNDLFTSVPPVKSVADMGGGPFSVSILAVNRSGEAVVRALEEHSVVSAPGSVRRPYRGLYRVPVKPTGEKSPKTCAQLMLAHT